MPALTGTHVIRNGLFLVDKWDPEKEGTKQLHEIYIENKVESLKRIAVIANLRKDMSVVIRREKLTATKISNNDINWNEKFAMLVEYIGENMKLPDQRTSELGKWYTNERKVSFTTARRVQMEGMKAIVSILYNHSCPR